jgi:hypothetical protein
MCRSRGVNIFKGAKRNERAVSALHRRADGLGDESVTGDLNRNGVAAVSADTGKGARGRGLRTFVISGGGGARL